MIFSLFLCRINQLYIDDLMISIEPERNDLQLVICSNEIDLPLFCITMSNVYFSIRIFLSLLSSSRGFFLSLAARGSKDMPIHVLPL